MKTPRRFFNLRAVGYAVACVVAVALATARAQAFAAVRGQLISTDETQETAKGSAKNANGERERRALDLYDRLLTIHNAANLQWPSEAAANAGVRDEFRLNTFPPRVGGAAGQAPAPPLQPKPNP